MCLKLAHGLDEVCAGSPVLCFLSIMRVRSLKPGNGCFSERVQPLQRALLCFGSLFQLCIGFEPKAPSFVPLMVFKSCLCPKSRVLHRPSGEPVLVIRGRAVFAHHSGLRLGSCMVWLT